MCGLTGFIDYSKALSEEHLVSMTDCLSYRGPDDSGTLVLENEVSRIGFGHRRLSIIDISSAGHQPMKYKRYHIVFNGEIYNYNEIRNQLIQLGHGFVGHSDTEMILHAFEEWNWECVHKFIGMFAFVIYDDMAGEVFMFRDRAGVKPLYYYATNNQVLFASEIKAFTKCPSFRKEIDHSSLKLYLQYGYFPAPYSIFKNTHKVIPGTFIKITLKDRSRVQQVYWSAIEQYNKPKLQISYQEAKAEVERLFISAFQYRMVADVPVGVFLSGGYDSTAVAAILQKHSASRLRTFTIGFHEHQFNEAVHARAIADILGTHHTGQYCTPKEALDIIPQLPEFFDEPFGDSSAIPTILVSRLAAKHVKVALSADAGDEIFAGYGRHRANIEFYRKLQKLPGMSKALLKGITGLALKMNVVRNIPFFHNSQTRFEKINNLLQGPENIAHYNKVLQQYFVGERADLVLTQSVENYPTFFDERPSSINDDLNEMLALDYRTFMVDDVLTKVDRATMSTSIEGREPLLDHRILEFVARLPSTFKDDGKVSKLLLKDIVHDYVPKHLVDRPKMGFGVPIEVWLKKDLKPLLQEYLDPARIKREGIFVERQITSLKDQYLSSEKLNLNINKLWFILMFQLWFERWMK